MKCFKPIASFSFLFTLLFGLASCEKSAEKKTGTHYSKSGIVMSGAQVVPTSTSPALGTMDVYYIRGTKILSYTITWSGLSGNPIGMGVYGLAPAGYAVPPTTPVQTISTSGKGPTDTHSGTLLVDELVIKEENLLNGLYYIAIRTAAFPAGEIRGQIRFQ